MKNILLIGKVNKNMKEVYDFLQSKNKYNIRICSEKPDAVEAMILSTDPDLAIISLTGLNSLDAELFSGLREHHLGMKVACFGSRQEQEQLSEYLPPAYYHMVKAPFVFEDIYEMVENLLQVKPYSVFKDGPTVVRNEMAAASGNGQEKVSEKEPEKEPLKEKHVIRRRMLQPGEKWKIMLVDDSPIMLRRLRTELSDRYEIIMANSGLNALRIMEKTIPDLILLDYDMPILNGRGVLSKLKERDDLKDIPVVFLTGEQDKDCIMDVMKLKPAGYLLKPPNIEKLNEKIEEILHNE